jgi:hypothetical protein
MDAPPALVVIPCCFSFVMLILFTPSEVNSVSSDWRLAAHNRHIDIDICIRCTSTVPGPQGPPGGRLQTQPILLLHEVDRGHRIPS